MPLPATPAEWVMNGGAAALFILLAANLRRMGRGLRDFIRFVAGVDHKIDAVEAIAPIAEQLQAIAREFQTNGGTSLRDAVQRIDERTLASNVKLDDISDEIRSKIDNQQIALNRHEMAISDLAGAIEDAKLARNTENERLRNWMLDNLEQSDTP